MTSPPERDTPTPRPPLGPRAIPLVALRPRPRRSPAGVAVSVVLHILLVLLVIAPWAWLNPQVRAGMIAALTGGGGGGRGGDAGGVAYISVPVPKAPPPSTPTPVPTAVAPPTPPQQQAPVVSTPVAPPDSESARAPEKGAPGQGTATDAGKTAGSGGGEGPGSGGGSGGATGSGNGGQGGRGVPPDNRTLALPPNLAVPKALRGKVVVVTFWVSNDGEVLRVTEDPPIGDAKYRREFEEAMRAYRFRPARDSLGRAVAATTTATITLGDK